MSLNTTLTVSTLLCHQHVPMALDCLGSLIRYCSSPLMLRIHDDGSLSEHDVEILSGKLGSVEFVMRKDADERIFDEYSRYRNILTLRKTLPLALKAFDVVVYCESHILGYVDSDVLFLKPFVNPFSIPNDGINTIFMGDRNHSYSLRSWQKLLSPQVHLAGKINTGLIVARKESVDFELMDWFFGKKIHYGIPQMLEQTFWALMGARVGCLTFDPVQVRVMRPNEPFEDLVAGHFTAKTRSLLPDFVRLTNDSRYTQPPVILRTVTPGKCTAWDLGSYELSRIVGKCPGCNS